MQKPTLYPSLALGLGLAAALLRMWQRSGYDESGLPQPMAVPAVVLTVFLVLCAGAFLYAALGQPKVLEDQRAALPRGQMAAALYTAGGVLVLAGGAVNLLGFLRSYLTYSQTLFYSAEDQQEALRRFLSMDLVTGVVALAAVPASIALLVRVKEIRAGAETVRPFAAVMPSVFCWLWLIKDFRQHTSNPIVWDYALLLLAIIALLISAYQRAGFAFGVGRPRRSVFSSLTALVLAVAALPDCAGLANALTLTALACGAWAELSALLSALEYKPRRLAGYDPRSEPKEDISHEG